MGQYSALIAEYEQKYNLPTGLLASLVQEENAPQNPYAVNQLGCRGLTQICKGHPCYASSYDAASQLDCTASSLQQAYYQYGTWEQAVASWFTKPSIAADPSKWGVQDVNRKSVAGYVSDIMGRIQSAASTASQGAAQIFTPGSSTVQPAVAKAIIIGAGGLLILVALLGTFGQRPVKLSLPG